MDTSFRILDGRTGQTRFIDYFPNPTIGEMPIAVDLDDDGSVEIVVPNYSCGGIASRQDTTIIETDCLRVYRHASASWPPGAPFWPHGNWSGTCTWPDGSVDRTCSPGWETYGLFRGQPSSFVQGMDLKPEIAEACVSEHPLGEAHLSLRLLNLGPQEAPAGTPITVYTITGEKLLTLTLNQWLDNGQASPTWEIPTTRAQVEQGLILVAGDPGTGEGVTGLNDCDLENNTLVWSGGG